MTSLRPPLSALWGVFLLVHVLVALLGWVYPSQPMGDVVLVYEPWATSALGGGPVVGVTETWVYPQLALIPMLVAKVLSLPLIAGMGVSGAYLVAWAVLVSVLDALAFSLLLGRSPGRGRRTAGVFWCLALFLLGPIALYRIDAVTVPLVVVAGLWLARRPVVASVLLTVGAWIKIWPGALVVAAVVSLRRRISVILAAAAVSVAVVLGLLALGADTEILGFLTEQTGRGLQIEAVAATPFLWLAVLGEARIEYSFDILTFQIAADGADAVSAALTPVMAALVLVIGVLGVVKTIGGASAIRILPPLALSLVTALIVANKVGSPQFQTWLIAPVVVWLALDRRRAGGAAVVVLALALLTCIVYPLTYDALLRAEVLPILVLSLRNLLLLVLLILGIRSLVRVPVPRIPVTPKE
ncbi:hypothetical protein ACI3KS_06440 [Microbacterium sp. ZW T5_45]|uniref:hypothetical protein n=1 Tax=Microbacterium sp. ZW T5_45 TaxID=3378080 RepID=UPI0038552709